MALAFLLTLCACTKVQPTWQEQYDLGVRYLEDGDYEEAIIAFTAAIEIDPKRASAYVGRGGAYVLSGEAEDNLTAARADFEKAIELDETLADAYLGLADVYIRQGDTAAAIDILEQGLAAGAGGGLQERLDSLLQEDQSGTDSEENLTVLHDFPSSGGPHLTVKTRDKRTGSITLSGISLQDSYTTNLSSSAQNIGEYVWTIEMHGDQDPFAVGTSTWADQPGRNEEKRLTEFQHTLWGPYEGYPRLNIGDVTMYYTADSITWSFTVPQEYDFDFAKVDSYYVEITDIRVNNGEISSWSYCP